MSRSNAADVPIPLVNMTCNTLDNLNISLRCESVMTASAYLLKRLSPMRYVRFLSLSEPGCRGCCDGDVVVSRTDDGDRDSAANRDNELRVESRAVRSVAIIARHSRLSMTAPPSSASFS